MMQTIIFLKIVIIKNNAVANCKKENDVIVNANREFRKKLYDCKNLFQVASYCYSSKDINALY